jgi:hypothetical protein
MVCVSLYRVFWYIGNGIAVGLAANRRGPIQKIGVPKFFGGYILYTSYPHTYPQVNIRLNI